VAFVGAAVGAVLGGCVALGFWRAQHSDWIVTANPASFALCLRYLSLAAPLPFVLPILLVTHRWSRVLAYALAVCLAYAPFAQGMAALMRSDGGVYWQDWVTTAMLRWIAIVVAGAILWIMIARAACRLYWFSGQEHDPSRCDSCRYEFGSEAVRLCPECGADRAAPLRRGTLTRCASRVFALAPWIATVTCAGLLSWAAVLALPGLIATLRLRAHFAERIDVDFPNGYFTDQRIGALASDWTPTLYIPIADEPDSPPSRGLQLFYMSQVDTVGQQMTISLSSPAPYPGFGGIHGSPAVVASLTPAQARRVIAAGIPERLIERILQEAKQNGWKAGGNPANWIFVDPEPFFGFK
jgi:hypothetical protein